MTTNGENAMWAFWTSSAKSIFPLQWSFACSLGNPIWTKKRLQKNDLLWNVKLQPSTTQLRCDPGTNTSQQTGCATDTHWFQWCIIFLIPILGYLKSCCSLFLWPKRVVFQYISEGIFIIFFSLYKKKVIIKKIGWLISFSDNILKTKKEWVKRIIIYMWTELTTAPSNIGTIGHQCYFVVKSKRVRVRVVVGTWQWPKIARDVQSR